jgi:hypothetical protein
MDIAFLLLSVGTGGKLIEQNGTGQATPCSLKINQKLMRVGYG